MLWHWLFLNWKFVWLFLSYIDCWGTMYWFRKQWNYTNTHFETLEIKICFWFELLSQILLKIHESTTMNEVLGPANSNLNQILNYGYCFRKYPIIAEHGEKCFKMTEGAYKLFKKTKIEKTWKPGEMKKYVGFNFLWIYLLWFPRSSHCCLLLLLVYVSILMNKDEYSKS